MSDPHAKIVSFLEEYAQAALSGDTDRIAASYHSTYLEASPSSVRCWIVDQDYKQALNAQSSAMHDDLGLRRLDIALETLTPVGPDHFLAQAQWTMGFDINEKSITSRFLISYLIRLNDDRPLILAYVSHEDQEAVMQRDGVIPSS